MTTIKKATGRKQPKLSKAALRKKRREIREDMGADSDVMRTPKIEGSVVRWVNDEMKSGRNRVDYLKTLGWEVYDGEDPEVAPPNGVTEANISLGSGAIMAAGIDREGKPMHAILMHISEEIYQMDQALKEEAIRETEKGIVEQGNNPDYYGAVRIGKQ